MVGVAGKSEACNTCRRRRVKVSAVKQIKAVFFFFLSDATPSATFGGLPASAVRKQILFALDMSEIRSSLIVLLRSLP
jgi:hypothetical protein